MEIDACDQEALKSSSDVMAVENT